MKISKKQIVLPLIVVLLAIGTVFEIGTGAFVKFGLSRWYDSTTYITSNRPVKVTGDLNVTGDYLLDGSPFTGTGVNYDTVMTKRDTGRFFHKLDTTRLAGIKRANTFTGINTFNGQTYTGNIETGNTTITGTLDVTNAVTFGDYVQLSPNGQFLKDLYFAGKLGSSTSSTTLIPHGLDKTTMQQIRQITGVVYHDTTALSWRGMYELNSLYAPMLAYCFIDSANIRVILGSSCVFTDDSVFITLKFRQ